MVSYASSIVSETIQQIVEQTRIGINDLTKNVIEVLLTLRRLNPSSNIFEEVFNNAINSGIQFLINFVNNLNTMINQYLDNLIGEKTGVIGEEEGVGSNQTKVEPFSIFGNIFGTINKALTGLIETAVKTLNKVTFGVFASQLEYFAALINGLINRIFPQQVGTRAQFLYISE